MQWLKAVLLNQYIGAIVVALLAYQAIISLVSALIKPMTLQLLRIFQPSSVPPDSGTTAPFVIATAVQFVLYAGIAILLAMWLYTSDSAAAEGEPTETLPEQNA
jgi:hypothetical protein